MKKSIISGVLIGLVVLTATAWEAWANCAGPASYHARQEGDNVQVCLYNSDGIDCPTESPMLRENIETGEVVRLADLCTGPDHDSCYLDECVPAGQYRYGMAEEYPCSASYCGGIHLFTQVVVAETATECALSEDNFGVEPYEGAFDWDGSTYSNGSCPDGGPLGGGCSTVFPGAINVFALNFFLGILGVFLVWRRSRKSR